MEHLNMQTPDGAQLNLDALYKLCPSCFTEGKDKDGNLTHKVNWNKLRELLGDYAEENAPESYDFTWVGKRAAQREAAAPINKTLRPCPEESVDWENTQNLYIEGDNLEVLKLLQNSYMGKIKMIYIDPPYNTGNDFVYHDDFAVSAEEYDENNLNEEGVRFRKNTDSNGRFHSDWCSMMYARLLISRTLLTKDGAIFISIDDNEVKNLKNILDEIFGESNFVGQIVVAKGTTTGQDANGIGSSIDYLLLYAKDKTFFVPNGLPLDEDDKTRFNMTDERGLFSILQYRKTGTGDRREDRPNLYFPLIAPDGSEVYPIGPGGYESRWRADRKQFDKWNQENMIYWKRDQEGLWKPYVKYYLEGRTKQVSNLWDDIEGNKKASITVKELLGKNIFDFPKPVGLIKKCISISTDTNSLVLDFFSGSATTAHAIMKINEEENAIRKFIMIQLQEDTEKESVAYKEGYNNICEIGKERIRRAGAKIKAENPNVDTGFRVFKCDSSNMKDVYFHPNEYSQDLLAGLEDNIKEDRTDLDLLFDCMLRWGVELSLPLSQKKVGGCTIHNVNDGDLVACFDGKITESVIDEIAAMNPLRVVFRDSSFEEASEKMNLFELFKQKCQWSEQEVKNNVRVI